MAEGSVDDISSRLSLWCRLTPRGLALVEYSSEDARRQVVRAVSAALPEEPFRELEVSFAPGAIEIVHRLVAELEALSAGVASVSGFGALFLPGIDTRPLVSALAFNRERLAAPPLKQIWWVPPHVAEAFLHGAPDFHSWFGARYRLTEIAEPPRVAFEWMAGSDRPGISHPEPIEDARRRAAYLAERFRRALADGRASLAEMELQLATPAVEALRTAGAEREAQQLERQLQREARSRRAGDGGQDDGGPKPPVTGTRHELPFSKLSPRDFERLCLWLVEREGFSDVEHLGASGNEQGRDVVAWRGGQRFAFQCKRVQAFRAADARKEIKKIRSRPPEKQPAVLVFVVTADVSASVRKAARKAWGDEATCQFWSGTELDERVKRWPELVAEFFQFSMAREGAGFLQNLPFGTLGSLFKGRDSLMDELAAGFAADPATTAIVQPQALCGLGGIGKTRLAVEYAWRSPSRYHAVCFVTAELPEVLHASLAALAGLLSLPGHAPGNESQAVAAVQGWLRTHDRWLLILDNADTPDAQRSVRELLPLSGGHVLITSRLATWPPEFRCRSLETLDREASVALLLDLTTGRRRTDARDEELADRLAHVLGDLPLALELAAGFVATRGVGFGDYLNALERDGAAVLDWYDGESTAYPLSVAKTWARTVDALSPPARAVLCLLAHMAAEPVPVGMLEAGSEIVGQGVAILAEGEGSAIGVDVVGALAELAKYSLLTRSGAMVSVHRMVQAVVRSRIPETQRARWAELAVRLLNDFAPDEPTDARTWPVWDALRPHAERAIELAEELRVKQPTSRLMNQLGLLLRAKGLDARAEPLYRRSLEIAEEVFGPDDHEVAARLNNLASLLYAAGRLPEAERLMRRALEIDERCFGSDHPDVAVHLGNLAQLLQATSRLSEAEPLMRRALEIGETAFGRDSPRVALRLSNLASLLHATGRFAEAEALLRRALEIDESALGADHPAVGIDLNNLAELLHTVGRLHEAEPLMRRALEILTARLPEGHRQIEVTRRNFAALLEAMSQPVAKAPVRA